jgi:hypothetical protein
VVVQVGRRRRELAEPHPEGSAAILRLTI